MTKVLFIDDDKEELLTLQRLSFATQVKWDATYVDTPDEAFRQCDEHAFDVVVAKLQMPAMDGRELLRKLKDAHPQTVRVIVSESKNPMLVVSSSAMADRFLLKPYDPRKLAASFAPLVALKSELSVDKLHEQFDSLDMLPIPPQHILDMNSELARPEPSIDRIAELITQDPSLSAKILQIVNSAAYGLSHKLSDIRHATAFIGLNAVRDLAVAVELESRSKHASPEINKIVDAIQAHSRAVAQIAVEFFDSAIDRQDAFSAALLHDAGFLALANIDSTRFTKLYELKTGGHCIHSFDSVPEGEAQIIGTSHASLGAYLLRKWGLPSRIVEAVAWHHNSDQLVNDEFGLSHAVHIADQISMQYERGETELFCRMIDLDVLDLFKVTPTAIRLGARVEESE